MLFEALKYLTTPCPAPYRLMGYLKEQIALEARYRRCRMAWAPHLDKTKEVIVAAAETAPRRRRAVVLGAGILADIPIETLSEMFESVVLVDVCLLRTTRRRLRKQGNVTFLPSDIAGTSKPLCDWVTEPKEASFPTSRVPDDIVTKDTDFVVSANVVSQLPILPMAYVQRRVPNVSADALQRFAQDIVRTHLAFLTSFSGSVCLVTETERHIYDGPQLTETEDPLFGIASGLDGGSWTWDVAPEGELTSGRRVQNVVMGTYWHAAKE